MKSKPRPTAGIDLALYDDYRPESDLRAELGLASNSCLVASVGASWCEPPHLFVRIAQQVFRENPETCFIWLGEHCRRCEVQPRPEQPGENANIVVLPDMTDTRLILSQIDIFLVTAPNTLFGYVTCEAMALGIPVIAPSVSGGEEIIESGRTGYMVPSDDEEMFAVAIRILLNDTKLRSRLGRTARERALERFDLSGMTAELERLFTSLSENRG